MSPRPCAGVVPSCAIPKISFLLLLLLLLVWASPPALASPSVVSFRGAAGAGGCNGSIAECSAEEEEFLMDSEIHRRMLQGSGGRYITYPSVRSGNRPVCNAGQGNSYTNNCVPPRSNDPSRPCNTYYRCRSGTRP